MGKDGPGCRGEISCKVGRINRVTHLGFLGFFGFFCIIRVRHNGDLDQGGRNKDKKWSYSGFILPVKLTRFADGLHEQFERKRVNF